MSKLIILVGCARSGKSTWAKNWANENLDYTDIQQRVIVNSDNVRLALHGQRYNKLAEPLVHAVTDVMIKTLMMNENTTVCVDETNTTVSSLRKWLTLDPSAEVVYIEASPQMCKQRAIETSQEDLLPVIDHMYNNLLKLCNYTIDKRIQSGEIDSSCRIDRVNKDDILMSIETIRTECK